MPGIEPAPPNAAAKPPASAPAPPESKAAAVAGGHASAAYNTMLAEAELRQCTGVGWIRNRGHEAQASTAQGPMHPWSFHCAGRQLGGIGNFDTKELSELSQGTQALFCAGQLSFLSIRTGGGPEGLWSPSFVHCNGLMVRFDEEEVPARRTAPAATSAAARRNSPAPPEQLPASESAPSNTLAAAMRHAEAIGGRASTIVSSVGSAAKELGPPGQVLSGTIETSRKISLRSAKIAKRSTEQLGRILLAPVRGISGRDEGGEPHAGSSSSSSSM